ncbi:PAS domain-containing sensor histidine kinase [Sphingomonas sp. FUKUSWIS1]|uniref:PAS domain-containing sensor histidine kinase n=1 Tax=Sphingomonas sp. FUKUSWIS1 TaxID=1379701 RepID=UPI0004DF521E|nr:PAS domain-containing sensor histidine kinase [Sphingomonas sp. FUKUSWIS1]
MDHKTASEGHRVLVCAPFGRDAPSIKALLDADGYDVAICPNLGAVAAHLDWRIGVLLLTEEALKQGDVSLREAFQKQPAWSDIPTILLAAQRTNQAARPRPMPAGRPDNSIVLERPLGKASLVSAVASAMRSRQKQFDMRDRQAELAESESRLRLATDAADVGTWDHDPRDGTIRWDARCKALFGMPADTIVDNALFLAHVHDSDRANVEAALNGAVDPAGDGGYDIEYRTIGMTDGVTRWVAARGGSFFADGQAIRFIGTIIDITARKDAEDSLDRLNRTLEEKVAERTAELEAEMATRARAEDALRQSQKMEAVGQLTGGIAHDFNNMLTGVIGGLDIIKRRIASGRLDDLDRFMDAASASAQRAAALTQRLLAFSRRQSLDTRPVDVNALTQSLEDLLRRTIRENIALAIVSNEQVGFAVTDANQLENAILNLVINARDAMPDGGQLTIETSLVELDEAYATAKPDIAAGRYVMVAVSDTGVGMSPDLVAKVFDPFFTTKPIGQGTGLGLSMVYGFARQSGGQVRIHSRPGEGTSVKLYLPAGEAPEGSDSSVAPQLQEGDGQTVLLVEDDDSVRVLIHEVLSELAYRTILAKDADEAIPVLASDQTIDLLVSDVGLPGMNGRQLAEIARTHRPELPVLFVTGYAENAAIRAGFLGTNMDMITKPFALDALGAKITEMLGG